MLPRLKAEEAMDHAERVNVGMGAESGQATYSRWRATANVAPASPSVRTGDPRKHLPPGFGVQLVERQVEASA